MHFRPFPEYEERPAKYLTNADIPPAGDGLITDRSFVSRHLIDRATEAGGIAKSDLLGIAIASTERNGHPNGELWAYEKEQFLNVAKDPSIRFATPDDRKWARRLGEGLSLETFSAGRFPPELGRRRPPAKW